MKTIKATFIIAALALVSYAATATGNLTVNMVPAEKNLAVVEIDNMKLDHFEIEVLDERGDLMFSKKTTNEALNYKKKYDFSLLENGIYTLRVEVDKEFKEKKFELQNGEIQILDIKKVVEPFFTYEDKAIKMSFLNFENEKVGLYVYSNNELLYEKSLGSDFAINHGLDFSKLEPGKYSVVLATDIEWFNHDVQID